MLIEIMWEEAQVLTVLFTLLRLFRRRHLGVDGSISILSVPSKSRVCVELSSNMYLRSEGTQQINASVLTNVDTA